jgi:transcription-repair coupling factor (superfamily II helicase)
VVFEKASSQFYLTQDYFEGLSATKLKATIGENDGKIEIIFTIRLQKDHQILAELLAFGEKLQEIRARKEEPES